MTDAKYFAPSKKGEIFELKSDLNSDKKDKQKEAVKKVIAMMTVGKDVSALFPDIIKCSQTDNLELKKLVYLYLMNYAKDQPDIAIMATATLVKDCDHSNPLIRALAVRTMGCIRVDRITEYMCDPLRLRLKDEDPYVRKTAAVCVAKMHAINPTLIEELGLLELLRDLVSDSNPMVVSNAVGAISEIKETSAAARGLLHMDIQVMHKLLTALNECTEWGQVFLLEAVSDYAPTTELEAQSILDRVIPRLAHANPAVVLAAIKVVMKVMNMISENGEYVRMLSKKLNPPLITLLSAEPEIQYVTLRNINIILQKRPDILQDELKVFFVKYNDPIYVKVEKLDIMLRLTCTGNIVQVLAELKEYATEVDVDFVRKSVRAIGRCALKVESAADRCVRVLLDLTTKSQNKYSYVLEEAIIVFKDIFRKYPNKYEGIIVTLCEHLDSLENPEARAAMIWIIGEYAERISNADELLDGFLDSFNDEDCQVQLQLLTAIIKLFLKKPDATQDLVQHVLTLATQESENPDLRDRGYIYWRLLSTDPVAAREVVLAEKPLISEETDRLEPSQLDELICHISSLASVYHKPPRSFVKDAPLPVLSTQQEEAVTGTEELSIPDAASSTTAISSTDNAGVENLLGDLIDMAPSAALGSHPPPPGYSPASPGSNLGASSHKQAPQGDLIAGEVGAVSQGLSDIFLESKRNSHISPPEVWLPSAKGKGLEVSGTFSRANKQVSMDLIFTNRAMQAMSDFALQLNKNSFGLIPAQQLSMPGYLMPGQTVRTSVVMVSTGPVQRMEPLTMIQVAMKNNVDVFYFTCQLSAHVLFTEEGSMDTKTFMATWKDIPAKNETHLEIRDVQHNIDAASDMMADNNVCLVAKASMETGDVLYQTIKLCNNIWVLCELKNQPNTQHYMLTMKSRATEVYRSIQQAYDVILHAD